MNRTACLLLLDTHSRSKNSKQIQQTVQNGFIHIFIDNDDLQDKDKTFRHTEIKNVSLFKRLLRR